MALIEISSALLGPEIVRPIGRSAGLDMSLLKLEGKDVFSDKLNF